MEVISSFVLSSRLDNIYIFYEVSEILKFLSWFIFLLGQITSKGGYWFFIINQDIYRSKPVPVILFLFKLIFLGIYIYFRASNVFPFFTIANAVICMEVFN